MAGALIAIGLLRQLGPLTISLAWNSYIAGNEKLRTDMKDILSRTNSVVTKLDEMMSKPTTNPDLKNTITQTRDAVEHIDLAARQMNQMLDQKRPLFKMLFGRPGHIRETQSASSASTH